MCNIEQQDDMDVPLQTIIKMTMFDDEEVLTCRTIWSARVLLAALHSCKRGLNMQAIMLALRAEARLRGYEDES